MRCIWIGKSTCRLETFIYFLGGAAYPKIEESATMKQDIHELLHVIASQTIWICEVPNIQKVALPQPDLRYEMLKLKCTNKKIKVFLSET